MKALSVEPTQQATESSSLTSSQSHSIQLDRTQTVTVKHSPLSLPTTQNSVLHSCSTQSVTGMITSAVTAKTNTKTNLSSLHRIIVTDREKPKKSNNMIRSKYKFLPIPFLAATSYRRKEKQTVKATTKTQTRHHTTKCRAFNRFKFFPDADSTKRIQRNDRKFLSKVEEYKQKKMVTDCRCEEKRCSCMEGFFYRFTRIFRFICRLLFLIFCPPCPNAFFHKLAFWPPPAEYFFFQNDDPTKKKVEAVQTANVKLRKANSWSTKVNNNKWRFGFEHNCFSELLGIDCFVVETKAGNHLASVLIKSPYTNPRYTLLFSHPNGSDISDHLTGIPSLQDTSAFLNVNIVAYDYSGYGISSGKPNELNLYSDIEAMYNYMRTTLNIPTDSIILWGFSIGTAATVHLASTLNDDLAGVILFAPPTSIVRALCWKRCCFCCSKEQPCNNSRKACGVDKFNSIGKIGKVDAPLLIVHGVEDEMVPIEHGQALHQHSKTKVSPLWVPDVGHNNLENSELLWTRVRDFIKNEARLPLVTAEDSHDIVRLYPKKRKSSNRNSRRSTQDDRKKSSKEKRNSKRRSKKKSSKRKKSKQKSN